MVGIERVNGDLVVGAATTLSEIAGHPETPAPLGEILRWFASPAIRNRATIGGNICNGSPAGDTLPFLYARDAVCTLERPGKSRQVALRDLVTACFFVFFFVAAFLAGRFFRAVVFFVTAFFLIEADLVLVEGSICAPEDAVAGVTGVSATVGLPCV